MRTFLVEWTGATVALLVAGVIRRALRRPQPVTAACTCPACRGCACSSCDTDKLWHGGTAAA